MNKKNWLNCFIEVGGSIGEKGKIDIYSSDLDLPPKTTHDDGEIELGLYLGSKLTPDTGVEKIGELHLDFSDVRHPKKRKLGRYSWVPQTALRDQTVRIGQIIYPDKDIIEFVATVGRKKVGRKEFVYKKDIQDDGNSNRNDREMEPVLIDANHYGGEDDGDDNDSEGDDDNEDSEESLLFCRR